MALEGEGHRVLKAGDGADALRILSTQPCDVVVCDEIMPVMNGRQLLAAIRADDKLASLPVILMSETWGTSLPEIEGALVLGKPLRLSELFAHVDRLAKARRTP